MNWQSGAQHGCQDNLVVQHPAFGNAQRGLHFFIPVGKCLADLIGKHVTKAFQVVAEPHGIFLNVDITQLCQNHIEKGILFRQNMRYHRGIIFVKGTKVPGITRALPRQN